MDAAGVASVLKAATTSTLTSSIQGHTSPETDGFVDWGEDVDKAIVVAVRETLSGAATSVYDRMAEELETAAARGMAKVSAWQGSLLRCRRPTRLCMMCELDSPPEQSVNPPGVCPPYRKAT